MAHFSVIQALEKLTINPYPTKKFRGIVNYLKNLNIILEEIHKVRLCHIDDILSKLSSEALKCPQNRFVPTVEIYRLLTEHHLPQTFSFLIPKLLYYLIFKLEKCTTDDAPSILRDFRDLKTCIFKYRKYSVWDNSWLDEIVLKFLQRVVPMMKNLNLENRETKFHLFSVMRIMITEVGKDPNYYVTTVRCLIQEIRTYYQYIKTLDDKAVNEYVFENHLTYLYITNDIIWKNFINNSKEEVKEILSDLKNIFVENVNLCQTRLREPYLVQNIMRVLEFYQSR